jgi:hypothetical protein
LDGVDKEECGEEEVDYIFPQNAYLLTKLEEIGFLRMAEKKKTKTITAQIGNKEKTSDNKNFAEIKGTSASTIKTSNKKKKIN